MDRIRARARRDPVCEGRTGDGQVRGEDAGVQILEIGNADRITGCLIRSGDDREVHSGDASRRCQRQRIRASAAIDGGFCAVVGNGIVARARHDDVGATESVDRVGA